MALSLGKDHLKFLNGKTQAYRDAIASAAHFDRDCPERLGEEYGDVLNEFRGAAIIGILSYFEEVVTTVYKVPRRFQPAAPLFASPRIKLVEFLNEICGPWRGWCEFDGLLRLRHCFGHSAGRVLVAHEPRLIQFEQWLRNGNALNRDGKQIDPYFKISANRVRLENSALDRCKIITLFALNHCGFIGPIKMYNLWHTTC